MTPLMPHQSELLGGVWPSPLTSQRGWPEERSGHARHWQLQLSVTFQLQQTSNFVLDGLISAGNDSPDVEM